MGGFIAGPWPPVGLRSVCGVPDADLGEIMVSPPPPRAKENPCFGVDGGGVVGGAAFVVAFVVGVFSLDDSL